MLPWTVASCILCKKLQLSIQRRAAESQFWLPHTQNPIQAIVTHPDHADVYARDVFVSGFHGRHLARMLDIACENQPQDGFVAAEVGAGTGGLTRQVSGAPHPPC